MVQSNSPHQSNRMEEQATKQTVWGRIQRASGGRVFYPDPRVTSISLLSNTEINFMNRSNLENLATMMYQFYGGFPRILELQCLPKEELIQLIYSVRSHMRSVVNDYVTRAGFAPYFYDSGLAHSQPDGEIEVVL